MSALPARRRRRPRAPFTFLEALSRCLPTPASCGGASETPWQRGRRQFASVIASDAMVAWLAVTKQGCQCAMVARLEAPGCFLCCWSLSLAGGDGREWALVVVVRVDVPIRPAKFECPG